MSSNNRYNRSGNTRPKNSGAAPRKSYGGYTRPSTSSGYSRLNTSSTRFNTGSNAPNNSGGGNPNRSTKNSNGQKTSNLAFTRNAIIISIVCAAVLLVVGISLFSNLSKDTDNSSEASSFNNDVSLSDIIVAFDDSSDETEETTVADETTQAEETTSTETTSAETQTTTTTAASRSSFAGTWKKTQVYESAKATITISNQTDSGFSFTFKIWSGSTTSSISGTASFSSSSKAVYTKGSATITFERGSTYLTVYHSGTNSALGLSSDVTIDGKFTTGTPEYYTDTSANTWDYYAYQSSAVVSALKSTLTSSDYELYTQLMSEGLMSPIAYERTVDKNGNKINVDTELQQVKYYAYLSGVGTNMIFICSNSGKIYLLLYDYESIRYYTNDSAYSSKMPSCFQDVANSKGITPTYM